MSTASSMSALDGDTADLVGRYSEVLTKDQQSPDASENVDKTKVYWTF